MIHYNAQSISWMINCKSPLVKMSELSENVSTVFGTLIKNRLFLFTYTKVKQGWVAQKLML